MMNLAIATVNVMGWMTFVRGGIFSAPCPACLCVKYDVCNGADRECRYTRSGTEARGRAQTTGWGKVEKSTRLLAKAPRHWSGGGVEEKVLRCCSS